MQSSLQQNPKSKIIETGYINSYSILSTKEKRSLVYKTRFKEETPDWDETTVYLSKKFKELLPTNLNVLDAGCGNGNYIVDENREQIAWATGVDASIESTLKNICLDEIKEANLEQLPFEDNSFNAVTSLWVLEHVEKPDKVLHEVFRVLKPNGLYLFSTPNKNYLPSLFLRLLKNNAVNYYLNKTLYDREEKDVFPTYYRANTVEDIKKLLGTNIEIIELRLNDDVSYTSFNEISYQISKLLTKLPSRIKQFFQPHIIGIISKTS